VSDGELHVVVASQSMDVRHDDQQLRAQHPILERPLLVLQDVFAQIIQHGADLVQPRNV
jgi:hypothetical protein